MLPLVQVEFQVFPRVLPRVQSFSMRVDSSLGEGTVVPADMADALASEAMSAAAEEEDSAIDVCLRMLPHVQQAAAQQFPGQVSYTPYMPHCPHISPRTALPSGLCLVYRIITSGQY